MLKISRYWWFLGSLICGLVLAGGSLDAQATAATYYLSPSGSDSNSGISSSAPWKTFAFAIPKLQPGDTLILRNGTYTGSNSGFPNIVCGTKAVDGIAAKPIIVKAENERQAWIKSDGSVAPFVIRNCSFWTIEGLRISSMDNGGFTASMGHVNAYDSNNLVFRRLLVHHNNRYGNNSLLLLLRSPNALVEESEFYSFHRHALLPKYSDNSIFRRNYCNSRGYGDILGGYPSGNSSVGDACISIYPGSDHIIENNVSEGNFYVADIMAIDRSVNNRFLGNISLGDWAGVQFNARGNTLTTMPRDTLLLNFVAVNALTSGVQARSSKNTRCVNCTAYANGGAGIVADKISTLVGDGSPTFFSENSLSVDNAQRGFYMVDQSSWGHNYPGAFNNSTADFTPSSGNITEKIEVDPQLGNCRVFIPDGSPMKRAGLGGADIGANVLYQYHNGVLTNVPLWDPNNNYHFTGCGAIIPGVNDISGSSCFDVHKRLNVNTNGCSLPSGYGSQKLLPPTDLDFVFE